MSTERPVEAGASEVDPVALLDWIDEEIKVGLAVLQKAPIYEGCINFATHLGRTMREARKFVSGERVLP